MNARRLAAGAVALLTALPLLATSGSAQARPEPIRGALGYPATRDAPTVTGADRPPVEIAVESLSPVSIKPGDVVTVTGTLTNTTDQDVRGLALLTGVGNRVTSRTALSDDLDGEPGIAKLLTITTSPPLPTTLAAHQATSFTLTIDVTANGLAGGQATVFPLVFRATGTLGRSALTTLDDVATYLPYFPGSVAAPLRVVWIWPLDAPPAAATPADAASVFQSGGRLRSLLNLGALGASPTGAGGRYAPVTWAVEPSLLDSAGQSENTAGQQWLADLQRVTRGQNVIPLPYGDPDAVALVRAGLSGDLANAIALGRANLAAQLPNAQLQSVAWPVDGAVDQPTLDAYAAAGLTAALVSGDQVPPTLDAGSATESAPVTLETRSTSIRGLAIDPIAQRLLAGNGTDARTAQMARQQLLALLAVAVAERPNQTPPRDLVLALPRDADPDPTWLTGLLHDTANLSWLAPVPLSATAGDQPGKRASLRPYPADARTAEIPTGTFTGGADSIAGLRSAVANFRSMFPDDKLTRPIDQTLSRAESVFWRPGFDPAGGRQLVSQAQSELAELQGGVRLAVANQVTLTSKDGKVPVTVDNALSEDVTVTIGLTATDPTRLANIPTATYTVPAGHKQRVLVPAKAQRSGTFKVRLVVATPAGMQLGAVPLTVHSKAYGTITLAITFTALGVLVLALLFRLRRRLRRWRADRGTTRRPVPDVPLTPTSGGAS